MVDIIDTQKDSNFQLTTSIVRIIELSSYFCQCVSKKELTNQHIINIAHTEAKVNVLLWL